MNSANVSPFLVARIENGAPPATRDYIVLIPTQHYHSRCLTNQCPEVAVHALDAGVGMLYNIEVKCQGHFSHFRCKVVEFLTYCVGTRSGFKILDSSVAANDLSGAIRFQPGGETRQMRRDMFPFDVTFQTTRY